MDNTLREMMRNYVKSHKFNSTAEIMEVIKDMFRDALQQVTERELEETLGYKKAKGCWKREKIGYFLHKMLYLTSQKIVNTGRCLV